MTATRRPARTRHGVRNNGTGAAPLVIDEPAAAPPRIELDRLELAEQSVLCAMLNVPEAVDLARQLLCEDDFSSFVHRRVFAAALATADRGLDVDPVTVSTELERRDQLAACGGREYIGELTDSVPLEQDVRPRLRSHASLVVEKAQERAVLRFLEDTAALVRSGEIRPGDLPDRVSRALATLRPIGSRFRLLTDRAVEQLPPLEYLVDGIIPVGGLAAVYGPPASGKSFAVLDLACCIATGEPWLGRSVRRRGTVVYVAAEGMGGLPHRLAAWKRARHREGEDLGVLFLLEAANLLEERDGAALLAQLRQLQPAPALIVFDTLHRSMPGGDENSAKDVGVVIENADRIRRETSAAVLLVHHSRKESEIERGSTSLRGAVDTLLQIKPTDATLTLTCEKQKDGPTFPPVTFALVPLFGSCVVQVASELGSSPVVTLTPHQRQALTSLSRDFLNDGATATQWEKASGVPGGSFWRVRTALVKDGYVTRKDVGRGTRYTVSQSGHSALLPNSQPTTTALPTAEHSHYHHSPTPLGVGVVGSSASCEPGLEGSDGVEWVPDESQLAFIEAEHPGGDAERHNEVEHP